MTYKRFLAILLAFLVALFAAFLLFRGVILENSLSIIKKRVHDKYRVTLDFDNARFEGLVRVVLTNLTILPPSGDTLLFSKKTAANISLIRYFKGQPPINDFLLENGFVQLVSREDSTSNYDFLLTKKISGNEEPADTIHGRSYSEVVTKLWNKFFGMADFNFNITAFSIKWVDKGLEENVYIEECHLNKTWLNVVAIDQQDSSFTKWEVAGTIDPRSRILDLHIGNSDNIVVKIPFAERISGVKFFLNSLGVSISMQKEKANTIRFDINAAAVAPGINHWRISPDDVMLDSVGVKLSLYVDDTSIYTGKSSLLIINQLALISDLSFSNHNGKRIAANININQTDADRFFNSLPKGLFSTLEGIKVKGKVSYNLSLDVQLENPDSLIFESKLEKSDFKVEEYGNENFSAINYPFTYTAREKDKVVRVFEVGPENPMYTPFDLINPLLINAVLTAEDGTFYFHRGFNEEAFRESMATNIKEKRFARGGSTITMQLVKNVFLNRNKTISRKVEEALIVWLIENNGIVSKQRMLEVYLNIIEWGPGIYGIGEASEFYFSKRPYQLSLEESIFLSSIIPRPKYFMYSFQKDGMLKEYLTGYFQLVAGRMLRKEIIQQDQFDHLQYQVDLKGKARQFVLPADSLPADSLMQEEVDDLF